MSKQGEGVEATLTDEQRAEWESANREDSIPDEHRFEIVRGDTLRAVDTRLTFLEASTVALRAELAQAREEKRRGEEALRAEIKALRNVLQPFDAYADAYAYPSSPVPDESIICSTGGDGFSRLVITAGDLRSVRQALAALASPDAPTREADGE